VLIDRFGKLSDTLGLSGFIEGPWDFTVQDKGYFVKVFISNVLTGTVSRLDLSIAGGKFLVLRKALVASGYFHNANQVTFEVGPTGLVYDAQHEILYVASTGDNEVFAVPDAGDRSTPLPDGRSKGTVIYADSVHLHGALAMAQAPNGHLLVSNSDGVNADPNQPIVEFTVKGQFIGELSVDASKVGSRWSLTARPMERRTFRWPYRVRSARQVQCLSPAEPCLGKTVKFGYFAPRRRSWCRSLGR
jgi:hypothetical protein